MRAPAIPGPPAPGRAVPGATPRWLVATIVAGLALGLAAEHVAESWLQPAWIPIADLSVGWLMIACGLAGAIWRPRQPAGPRLAAAGFLWFVGTFQGGEADVIRAIGFSFGGYHDLVLAWLALSFPASRPSDRLATGAIRLVAGLYVAQTLARLVLSAPDAVGITILDPDTALGVVLRLDVVRGASLLVAAAVMLLRLARAASSERRQAWVVLVAGVVSAVGGAFTARYALTVLGLFPDLDESVVVPLQWAFNILRVAAPLAIVAGVLQARGARAAMADAVTEMGSTPSAATLRDALATAFRDPELRVMTWSRDLGAFVDSTGPPVATSQIEAIAANPGLVSIPIDDDGELRALIVTARTTADDPALVDAAVALTRLVIRNEEQSLRIREQLADVRASRARMLEAADVERRRIERDLHDGLQQRMLALAMQLRAADGDPAERAQALRRGSDDVLALLASVRELARGIHPAVLTEAGLGPAIRAAADRSPVPVEVDLRLSGRLADAAEATAYYVVSESLANVAKHAPTSTAVWVRADDSDGVLRVAIEDDGPGGAKAEGHGLAGLADRVAALDGRFAVEDRAGSGTRIVAEIPLS